MPKNNRRVTVLSGCLIILLAFLAGCYRMPISQGNQLNPSIYQQLQIGMSKKQVRQQLGDPVLVNLLNGYDEWHYAYTLIKSRPVVKTVWVLYFKNDRLVSLKNGSL